MHTYIGLCRGINVGGKNILPMKELRRFLEDLGCENVRTYIQSGNVVLRSERSADELAAAMSAAIEQSRGFSPQVWLFTQAELQTAVDRNPFSTEVGKALHLFFLEEEPDDVDRDRSFEARGEAGAMHPLAHDRPELEHGEQADSDGGIGCPPLGESDQAIVLGDDF